LAGTIAELDGSRCDPSDAARSALRLWRSYSDPLSAFRDSASGRRLLEIGHAEDLDLCARVNGSEVVPRLAPGQPLSPSPAQ
jgi:phosphosulfolactate phosphohydrolase-like enzyme